MPYDSIKKKLEDGKIIILDGSMGAQLEKKGAQMDKDLWCGKCSINNPDLVKKVHEEYIEAGADIITTNTYATTPISMRQHGLSQFIEKYNQESVKIAKDAVKSSKKDIAIAGSVSTFGNFYKLGTKAMIPGFNEQLKILSDSGVDLIILEAMSSQADIVKTIIECSTKIDMPIWLSISCVMDEKNQRVMLGYNDTIDKDTNVYESLDDSITNFSKLHTGPILIAHSDIGVTGHAIKNAKKKFTGILGAYPNKGYYEKPNWKFVEDITPDDYLKNAKNWVKDGVQIIGGCCGIGPDFIKPLSELKK